MAANLQPHFHRPKLLIMRVMCIKDGPWKKEDPIWMYPSDSEPQYGEIYTVFDIEGDYYELVEYRRELFHQRGFIPLTGDTDEEELEEVWIEEMLEKLS